MNNKHYLWFLLLAAVHWSLAAGTTYKSNEYLNVGANDTLPGDLFYGGRSLGVDGSVKGDVIAGAQEITITGHVEDDMYAWAEVVRMDGEVGDILLGFGKEIIITGKIRGDLIAYGGSVRLLDGAEVKGNVYVGTGYFSLQNATVHGDIFGGAGKVRLNGPVGGNIDLSAGVIEFGNRFSSNGAVEIELSHEPAEPIANAPANLKITIEPEEYFYQSGFFYYFLMVAFVIGAIILGVFPALRDHLVAFGQQAPGPVLLTGLVFTVITPMITIFAFLLLPLAFILGAFYFIVMYLSKIFSAYILGNVLFKTVMSRGRINPYLSFFTGLVLIYLLLEIPVAGFFIWIITFVVGSGSFIYYLYSLRKNGTKAAA